MPKYLCNLIIPGAAKSGTSSLHSALGQHPEITISSPKEPQFFSFEERFEGGAVEHNKIFDLNADARYYVESSQCYFVHPYAVERIKNSLVEPKIIIILRDPIKRLLSQYKWNFRRGTETDLLADAVRERGDVTDYTYDERILTYREVGGYSSFSRYSSWVPLWQKTFGVQNVMLIDFEDFVSDEKAVLDKCFSFLGLEKIDFSKSKTENTTETTYTKIIPKKYLKVSKRVPTPIKNSYLYKLMKQKIIKNVTPIPEAEIDVSLSQKLEDMLADDIVFYNNFRDGLVES